MAPLSSEAPDLFWARGASALKPAGGGVLWVMTRGLFPSLHFLTCETGRMMPVLKVKGKQSGSVVGGPPAELSVTRQEAMWPSNCRAQIHPLAPMSFGEPPRHVASPFLLCEMGTEAPALSTHGVDECATTIWAPLRPVPSLCARSLQWCDCLHLEEEARRCSANPHTCRQNPSSPPHAQALFCWRI